MEAPPQQPPLLPPQLASQLDPFATTPDERTLGMLCHLLGLLTGFLGPLILWLVKKDESRFIDYHGKESLNFQLSVFIYSSALSLISIVIGVVTCGYGLFIIFPIFFAMGIFIIVIEIIACCAANRGEWYRCPWTIRLIS